MYGAADPLPLSRGSPGARRRPRVRLRGAGIELGPEGGVFSNEFLIPLAFDRRLGHRGDLADRFGVFQVRVDGRDDDACLDGDQVDTDQRDTDPCVDDDPFVENSVEDVNKTCAACGSFNGHQTLLESCERSVRLQRYLASRRRAPPRQRRQLPLERAHLLAQLFVLRRQRLLARRQMVIELPPVEADLLGLVDRADEQPDPDRQQLDFRQRHLDVAGDDEPLVEDPVEHVDEPCRSSVPLSQWRRHRFAYST